MFKKTKIAAVTAAVLGMSSMAAQAVLLNDAGSQGQVLIFPYYNVNESFITAFNITNTTDETKAVKIRFRTSKLSNDVLDFNLYLSPYDVFTMSLKKTVDDKVLLTTQDKSCTHPTIKPAGVTFRDVYESAAPSDLLEGYLEVIEMGVLRPVVDPKTDADEQQNEIVAGINHVNGVPEDCDVIEAAWQNKHFNSGGAQAASSDSDDKVLSKATGYPAQPAEDGWYGLATPANISAPTGGLVGSSILVDAKNIAGFVAEPLSVLNYSSKAQHYLSSDESFYLLPSLASGNVATSEYMAHDGIMPVAVTHTYSIVKRDWGIDDPNSGRIGVTNPRVPSGVNPMPIADALLVTTVGNQYFLGAGTHTDWVFATPMRKHAIYNDYAYSATKAGYVAGEFVEEDDGTKVCIGDVPVEGTCGDATSPGAYWDYLAGERDVNALLKYWDREEEVESADPGDFSPPEVTPDTSIEFPREVNIFALNVFGDTSEESVLGSVNARNLSLASGFVNGWGLFSFKEYNLADTRYEEWVKSPVKKDAIGAPVHGFMAARSAIGTESVGETFPHFTTRARDCSGDKCTDIK